MSDWLNQVFCEDALSGLARIPDGSVDLILTDPPYNLGKDYGNASDQQTVEEYLLDRAVDRRGAAQAETERQPVHLPDLALFAGNLRHAQAAHDDDE